MSMSFGVFFILLFGGGNDALDYIQSQAYWKAKGVEMTAPALIGELTREAPAAEPGVPKAAAIRRLMAIRALGELKDRAALAPLTGMVESKEMFVGEYARAAIAAIEGKPFKRPSLSAAQRREEVWGLPARCDLVGQFSFGDEARHTLAELIDTLPLPPDVAADKERLPGMLMDTLLPVLERTGNFRVDCVTVGVFETEPGKPGWGVIQLRGKYDSQLVESICDAQKRAGPETVAGMKVYALDPETQCIFWSDDRLVILPNGSNPSAAADVIAAMKADGGGGLKDQPVAKLIGKIDSATRGWCAMTVTDWRRQAAPKFPDGSSVLSAFDRVTITLQQKEAETQITLKAEGTEASKVTAAANALKGEIEKAIAFIKPSAEATPSLKPIPTFLQSVKVEPDAASPAVNVTAQGDLITLISGYFMARSTDVQRPGPGPDAPPKSGGL